jgi:hypothetical protein
MRRWGDVSWERKGGMMVVGEGRFVFDASSDPVVVLVGVMVTVMMRSW